MVTFDVRELFLKGGDARLGIAIACGLFIFGERNGWIPSVEAWPWVIPAVWGVGLLFACLWAVEFLRVIFALAELLWLLITRRK